MRQRDSKSSKVNGGFGPITSPETLIPREQMIAEAAYYIAQARGFDGDHELDDWLEAEAEINREHPSLDSDHAHF